jgi:hypothetical protein
VFKEGGCNIFGGFKANLYVWHIQSNIADRCDLKSLFKVLGDDLLLITLTEGKVQYSQGTLKGEVSLYS